MVLAAKVVLKDKGASAALPEVKQAMLTLSWTKAVDLDLMAFGKKKDGSTFGVFTEMLSKDPKTQGDLNAFPFMQLSKDAGVGAKGGANEETIKLYQLDSSIDEVHFVCLNYTDASQNKSASFANYDATINMINDKGENLIQGQLNDATQGVAAHLCTIKNGAICGSFINQNKVMSLQELIANIPGANAILA
jgi:tellurite resistance protein TerA